MPESIHGSIADFDNFSIGDGTVVSIQSPNPRPCIPGGGFSFPNLSSLTDTVAYEMWKNTIGYFHLSGRTNEIIMPMAYQSLEGDMAHHIMIQGPMALQQLIVRLDNTYRVVVDEDTLTKELYSIKQGSGESVNHFDTCIGYAMMRLAAVFLASTQEVRGDQEVLVPRGALGTNLKGCIGLGIVP